MEGRCAANLTQTDGDVSVLGEVSPSATQVDFVVNARVEMSPEDVEHLVRTQLQQSCHKHGLDAEVVHLQSLRPGRPTPTHRYDRVVDDG